MLVVSVLTLLALFVGLPVGLWLLLRRLHARIEGVPREMKDERNVVRDPAGHVARMPGGGL